MKKPSYKQLLKERDNLIKKISELPCILRGNVRKQGNICGMPGCKCKDPENPKPHGPYNYLSHRYKDKSQSILLTGIKLPYANEWTKNYKKMIQLVYRLSEINFRIIRYHYDKLEEK